MHKNCVKKLIASLSCQNLALFVNFSELSANSNGQLRRAHSCSGYAKSQAGNPQNQGIRQASEESQLFKQISGEWRCLEYRDRFGQGGQSTLSGQLYVRRLDADELELRYSQAERGGRETIALRGHDHQL